jgi:hypothetical protein
VRKVPAPPWICRYGYTGVAHGFMKTTIEIDDDLLLAGKQHALQHNTTLREVVEAALTQYLNLRPAVAVPIKTIVYGGPTSSGWRFPSPDELAAAAYADPVSSESNKRKK